MSGIDRLKELAGKWRAGSTAMWSAPGHARIISECAAELESLLPELEAEIARLLEPMVLQERIAQITAHRACCGTEHDPVNGKLHGYCVVCGIPWPCEYAGTPPVKLEAAIREAKEGR